MTNAKQPVECPVRDRPANEREIVVTPTMTEAGARVIYDFSEISDPYELARQVYIAMAHMQPRAHPARLKPSPEARHQCDLYQIGNELCVLNNAAKCL